MITTTTRYALARGITSRAVRKAIVMGHCVPAVSSVQKFGRDYLLNVEVELLASILQISEKKLTKILEVP